uniref:Ovule protein n=1 Tax=Haemonchus contortus TaxID=6289 RepID=A0A7I4Y542_HAECO
MSSLCAVLSYTVTSLESKHWSQLGTEIVLPADIINWYGKPDRGSDIRIHEFLLYAVILRCNRSHLLATWPRLSCFRIPFSKPHNSPRVLRSPEIVSKTKLTQTSRIDSIIKTSSSQ